jgi:hypothetical protein
MIPPTTVADAAITKSDIYKTSLLEAQYAKDFIILGCPTTKLHLTKNRIAVFGQVERIDTSYGLPPDEDGNMEITTFLNHFTQRRPNHAILQSATQILLRYRSACEKNVRLHTRQ